MKIAVRGGHNFGVTGAHGILDEVIENRKYTSEVINYLRKAGHEVLDVTPYNTASSAEDLSYGVSRANAWGAELFISDHVNSGKGKGCEVIYFNGSVKGKEYATKVVNAISSLGFANRGAKPDTRNLYEPRVTKMPAIIIEPFFLDTQSDVDLYNKIGPDKLGKAIAEAIHGKPIEVTPVYPGYLIKYNPSKIDANVKLIQEKLKIEADGKFGPITLSKVKSFQNSNCLSADGIVGPMTWIKLFN